jgi:hypothetical protein
MAEGPALSVSRTGHTRQGLDVDVQDVIGRS